MEDSSSRRNRRYEERVRGLSEWEDESKAAVYELAEVVGIDPPSILVDEPRLGLVELEELLCYEELEKLAEEDAVWTEWHVLAFVGEYLIHKFDGVWVVDDDPESSTFGRYLVAARSPADGKLTKIDVRDYVHSFLFSPPGRSFIRFIGNVEREVAPM